MKDGIHPEYRWIIFQDGSADYSFLCRSTLKTNKTGVWKDGKEYPVFTSEITSASHPFFTGKQMILDTEGRVEKFMQKYGMKKK